MSTHHFDLKVRAHSDNSQVLVGSPGSQVSKYSVPALFHLLLSKANHSVWQPYFVGEVHLQSLCQVGGESGPTLVGILLFEMSSLLISLCKLRHSCLQCLCVCGGGGGGEGGD